MSLKIEFREQDLKRARMMIHRTKTLASPSLLVTAVPGQLFPIMKLRGKPVPFDRVLCDVPCSGILSLCSTPSSYVAVIEPCP